MISRNEKILNAILDNDFSKVEKPQSRIEALLIKVAEKMEKIQNGASGVPIKQEMTASDTDVELQPNIFYLFPEMESLDITFADQTDTTTVEEYHFLFQSGATATTLTLPDTVKLPSGFSIDANKVYEISILEGCLCYQSWEVTTDET